MLKGHNKMVIDFDVDLAKKLKERLLKLSKYEENFKTKKFYFESIFLDLTDRTQAHPQIRFARTETKEGLMKKIGQEIGFGEQQVVWELPLDGFDLDSYFSSNWFHSIIDSYQKEKEELETSKNSYIDEKINFFDYFKKRLEIYDICQPSDHVKYFEGTDRKKYFDFLRKVFNPIL